MMFDLIRKLFLPKRVPDTLDADLIGDDLDMALDTYGELLDNNCRDQMVLDIARERIADLHAQYTAAKADQMEDWSSK